MPTTKPTLLVAQSGGATAVINASLAGVATAARDSGAFGRILGARGGIEGLLQESFIDLTNLEPNAIQLIARTPSATLGTGRHKLAPAEVGASLDILTRHGVSALLLIGGNDSADTVSRIHHAARQQTSDVCAISIPKTVDNDLPATDHCPGYGSMAKAVATIVRDATWDTLASPALYPVKFIEVMGRDAGWVAAAGSLAFDDDILDLAPLVLLPEHPPTSIAEVVQRVERDIAQRGWSVVVVPETLRTAAGDHLGGATPEYIDPHGHPYYPSAGAALARVVTQETGLRARFEKPGSFARMATILASTTDRQEAFDLGRAAVDYAVEGLSGVMPALVRTAGDVYACSIEPVSVDLVANQVRALPPEFLTAGEETVSPAFRSWALPLLGPNPFPPYSRPLLDMPVRAG